ncbi:MAG: hypothetical protein BZ136_03830 [Methanosphaera sp. rholeuAM74]|nr:MAG: hypothetical protein BZ136_03830 [Methanosphaera sp. rholeuAM74]
MQTPSKYNNDGICKKRMKELKMKTKKLIFFIFMTAILLLGLGVISATNSTEYGQVDTVKQTPQTEYKEVNKIDKESNERSENVKTATKPETQVKLTPQTLNKQKNITIPVTVTTKSNAKVKDGRVSLYLNGNLLGSNALINGQRNMTITKLDPGTYTVKVTYNSTKYQPSTATTTLKINPATTTLSLNSQTVYDNQKITVPITVKDSTGSYVKDGRVSLYLNNKLLGSNALVNGQRNMQIDKQKAGTYTLKAVYNSTNYKTSSKTATLTVTSQSTMLTLTSQTVYDNEKITVPVTVRDSTGAYVKDGRVSLYLNNKLLGSNALVDGQRNMLIDKQKAGTYTLRAVYNSNNYKTSSKTATLTVISQSTTLYMDSIVVDEETSFTVPVYVEDSTCNYVKDGRVSLYLNNKLLGSNALIYGGRDMIVGKQKAGTYTLRAVYNSDNYKSSSKTTTLTVKTLIKPQSYVEIYSQTTTPNTQITIPVTVTDEYGSYINGGRVTLTCDGNEIGSNGVNYGTTNMKINSLTTGTHNIRVDYTNTNYKSSYDTATITVNKIPTKITQNSVKTVDKGKTTYISGQLTDNNGNPLKNTKITITVNSAQYSTTTNSYGDYNYQYKASKIGTNTATITYTGNAKYASSTAKTTFTVKDPQYKTFEISISKGKTTTKQIGKDEFCAWYQTYDGQYDRGVYIEVWNKKDALYYPTENTITDAVFYFKDSYGDVITRSYVGGYGVWLGTHLVSGYTPFKIKVTYRKTTSADKKNFDLGKWWSSKTNSWEWMDWY